MVESLGIGSDKIETLTLGIDTDRFALVKRPQIRKSGVLRLVCTRRLESVFDHHTIVDALVILRGRGVKFETTFAGDGSLLGELTQHVRNVGLDDSVNFAGRVDNDKLPEVLGRNDIYLSASLWDGASLSLLEAMASGLFPIVSDIEANSAWLKHNVDGLLHKVSDPDDLAKCILQLCSHPELAARAVRHNRERVVESGARRTNMKRLEGIYEDLAAKRR
jgi:glycosyltransferase involved in cell wall biosynthesis